MIFVTRQMMDKCGTYETLCSQHMRLSNVGQAVNFKAVNFKACDVVIRVHVMMTCDAIMVCNTNIPITGVFGALCIQG